MPILVVALGIVAAILMLTATPYGTALAYSDPISYITAGRSLARGEGILGFDGLPMVRWPPFFPALVAIPTLLGSDGVQSLRLVNALALGITASAAVYVFRSVLRSKALALLGGVAVMTNWSLFQSGYFGFSEVVYTALLVGFLLYLPVFLREKSPRALFTLAIITALASLTRYLGMTLIAAGGLCILLLPRAIPLKQRLLYALGFGIVASLPLALWYGRNLMLMGSIAGTNWADANSMMQQAPDILASWFVPDSNFNLSADATSGALLSILFAGLLALVSVLVSCRLRFGSIRAQTLAHTPVVPAALVLGVFMVMLTALENRLMISINNRMFSPIVVPVMLLAFALVDAVAGWLDQRTNTRLWSTAALILVALWLYLPGQKLVKETRTLSSDDSAMVFNNLDWQNAPLIQWLKTHQLEGRLYSNAAFSVAALTPHYSKLLPTTIERWSNVELAFTENYLVWFDDVKAYGCNSANPACYLPDYTLDELKTLFDIEPIIETGDGGVYHLSQPNEDS